MKHGLGLKETEYSGVNARARYNETLLAEVVKENR